MLRQNSDADVPGCNADDKGENDRGLTANGHQNLIAQPGTQLSDRVPANTPDDRQYARWGTAGSGKLATSASPSITFAASPAFASTISRSTASICSSSSSVRPLMPAVCSTLDSSRSGHRHKYAAYLYIHCRALVAGHEHIQLWMAGQDLGGQCAHFVTFFSARCSCSLVGG